MVVEEVFTTYDLEAQLSLAWFNRLLHLALVKREACYVFK